MPERNSKFYFILSGGCRATKVLARAAIVCNINVIIFEDAVFRLKSKYVSQSLFRQFRHDAG
jgi:hypothetical protein